MECKRSSSGSHKHTRTKKKKSTEKKKQVGDKYQTEDLSCKPVENTERNRVSSHLESAVKEKNKRKDSSFLTFFFFFPHQKKKKRETLFSCGVLSKPLLQRQLSVI